MKLTIRNIIFLALHLPLASLAIASQPNSNQTTDVMDVYGNRYSQPLTIDKPGETLLSRQQIETEQPTNIAELFEDIPGVSIDGGARSGGEKISIWGFSDPSDIGLYVDGAPIGFEQYRYGTFFFDPYLIGEAEVIKGSHDYKSNGKFGGTIRIRTKTVDELLKPGRNFGARVHLGYNDNDARKHTGVSVFGQTDAGLYFLASGTWKDSNDIKIGGGEALEYSAYTQNNGLVKVGYQNADHLFEISHSMYKDEGRQPWAARRGAFANISNYNIKKYGSLEAAKYAYTVQNEYKDSTTSLQYAYDPVSPLVNLKVVAAHTNNERHWRRPDIAWEKMFVSIGSYGHESWASYKRDYVDINNEMEIGRHRITSGVQYEKNTRDTLAHNVSKLYVNKPAKNFGVFIPYYDPSGVQTSYSAYLADEIDVTARFRITPSIRYDHVQSKGKENPAPDYNDPAAGHDYSSVSHSGLSPRIQLDYDLTDSTLLNFSYAYQMKAPSVDDIYAVQYARAKASATARQLEAQRIHAYRASVINHLSGIAANDDVLTTEVTTFYNGVTNNVMNRTGVNLDRSSGAVQSWKVNLDGYKNYGVDFQAQYRLERLYLDASVSYIEGKHNGSLTDASGQDTYMYGIPPVSMKLGFGYEWIDGLITGYKARWYHSQEKVEDSIYFPAASEEYILQDIYLSWQPQAAKDLMLRATIKNLKDVDYKPYLSNGVSGPGREIRVSLTYDL